jgi:multimeric flavodoxin WrbA
MALKVLGISASPRERGNTDLLLREALRGAEAAGAEVEVVALRDLKIGPCIENYSCARTGECGIEDDYQAVYAKLLATDRLVFATPVFFMGPSAQAKLLIDRCQCLWARKYLLKQPLFADGPRDRRAMVIAVGGTKGRKMFECVRLTMKYFFDAAEFTYAANLFVNQVDGRAEILRVPRAMAEAARLGSAIAAAGMPPPKAPETVELSGGAETGGRCGEET